MADISKVIDIAAANIAQVAGIEVANIANVISYNWPALGPSWSKVLTLTGNWVNGIAYDQNSVNHNLVAAVGRTGQPPQSWYSANGGAGTWTQSSETFSGQTWVASLMDQPDDGFMLAGCYDTGFPKIFKSIDGGVTWSDKSYRDTRSAQCFGYDSVSGYSFMGSSLSGKVWRSIDNGETWVEMQALADIGGFVHEILYDSINDVLIAAGGSNGADIWKSTNDGVTWVKKQEFGDDGVPPGTPNIDCHCFCLAHDTSYDTLIAGAGSDRGQIWLSDDAGETWTKVKDLWTDSVETSVLSAAYDVNRGRLYVGTQGRGELWYSEDGGYTWTRELQLLASDDVISISDIAYDPSTFEMAFCTTSNIGTLDGTVWTYS